MSADLLAFNQHRPRLLSIAYRMLGSRSDAEDILQDAYLRWHHADIAGIDNHEAWLVTVVTRLCIDKLRVLKTERENYIGPWIPEPIVIDETDSPERAALNWAERVTALRDGQPDDNDYAIVCEQFSGTEIAALTYAIAIMNAWNRIAISLRNPVARWKP